MRFGTYRVIASVRPARAMACADLDHHGQRIRLQHQQHNLLTGGDYAADRVGRWTDGRQRQAAGFRVGRCRFPPKAKANDSCWRLADLLSIVIDV